MDGDAKMKLYKLTTQDNRTRVGYDNETLWGAGVTHKAPGNGRLCSSAFIHAYEHPYIAVLMNSYHANIRNPKLWLCEAVKRGCLRNGELKIGVTKLTTVRELELPHITTDQRIEIAIRCALTVCNDAGFVAWANSWLDGTDRSTDAAARVAYVARVASVASVAARAARVAYVASVASVAADAACVNHELPLLAIITHVCGEWTEMPR
jgi:hypothetical protein